MSWAKYFALVCISAVTISFIVSLVVYKLGVPVHGGDYVRMNLFVTACIAIPTAIIATLNAFHTRAYQRQLETLAWTDELTGLLNRRFFLRAAEDECRRLRRDQKSAAIAFIDLDFFKEVNDRYGHAAGDRALKSVARIAHGELRGPFDKLGRWGGEEFVVLMSDSTPEKARVVCERLRNRIQSSLINTGEFQVRITASFGFCMLGSGADVNGVIEAADRALYEAKRLGRNCVVMGEYTQADVQNIADHKHRTKGGMRRGPANDDIAESIRAVTFSERAPMKRRARLRSVP
ncbi:MAG: GGDEF domain-containing protein [Hyphomonas sp.]|uniref:GGDEF domain-containing protein n=1 Tax=Hyphomonas sp. TaxID=87 RepID=UPI0034A0A776